MTKRTRRQGSFPFAYSSKRQRIQALARMRRLLDHTVGGLFELGLDVMAQGHMERDEAASAQASVDAHDIADAARALELIVARLPHLGRKQRKVLPHA